MADKSPPSENSDAIMVVDDIEDNVYLLKVLLESAGYRVTTCFSGEEALKRLEDGEAPDLVLLDVMMPGIDGYETCRRIHAMPGRESLPIIMLTARRELESKIRGLESGAHDYIVKPFQREEVMARVRSLLTIRNLQRELVQAQKKATVGEMMITLNHEINNPLAAILGNTELLMMEVKDLPEGSRRKLETIYRESMRIRDILKRINNLREVHSTRYLNDMSMIDLNPERAQDSDVREVR
ncbi:response regulator [bacterium]|nr:response regulator [bacterium]